MMTITLNGTNRDFPDALTMTGLLEAVGLTGKPVIVEQNQLALLPKEIISATLQHGDVIEIVQITAGG
jgi:sulfur carrier protein